MPDNRHKILDTRSIVILANVLNILFEQVPETEQKGRDFLCHNGKIQGQERSWERFFLEYDWNE